MAAGVFILAMSATLLTQKERIPIEVLILPQMVFGFQLRQRDAIPAGKACS
jgi:hypothetical protein